MENWPQWANSMADASRITGMSRTTLAAYKREGADGFKSNGRIDLHVLRDWMLANGREAGQPSTELQQARIRLLNAQSAKVERENRIRDNEVVLITEVRRVNSEVSAMMFNELQRFLLNDQPPMAKGRNELEIYSMNKKFYVGLSDTFRAKVEALAAKEVAA